MVSLVVVAYWGFWPSDAKAQMYKCADASGHVSYQQRPCDGTGTKLNVRPANEQVREPTAAAKSDASPASTPMPASADKLPPQPNPLYQKPGFRLSPGMTVKQVVEMWGLPTDTSAEREHTIMHWCDARIALLVKALYKLGTSPSTTARRERPSTRTANHGFVRHSDGAVTPTNSKSSRTAGRCKGAVRFGSGLRCVGL